MTIICHSHRRMRKYISDIQKVLNFTLKEENSWTFLLGKHTTTSYKIRNIWISFLCFIKSGSGLPQQKCSAMTSISGQSLEIFEQPLFYWKNSFDLRGYPCGVMVKVMDWEIVVSEFVLQSSYYVHFWENTLGIGRNSLILPAMG